MVQPADLRDGDDFSDLARLYRPLLRAILVQGKMRPGAVIVINVRRKHPAQMVLVEDDQVVQAFSPDRADDPLNVGVLPR